MVEIRVPATSANIGSGFDCLGFALQLYNIFRVERVEKGLENIVLDQISGKNFELSLEDNLYYQAISKVYDIIGKKMDCLRLTEEVNIPFARGLGSSASAVVAGLIAGNYLTGNQFSEEEIIKLAVEIEGHPDNVLPALKGGFIINVISEERIIHKKLELDNEFQFVIIIPDFKLKTDEVRRVLPDKISFDDAIFNLSRASLLTACLHDKDFDKLKIAMEDRLHQDYRAKLIPGFHQVVDAAYQKGALGVSLSGSGPSILAIVNTNATDIGETMAKVFEKNGISSTFIVKCADNEGCKIIS